jgi:hypothetical protein
MTGTWIQSSMNLPIDKLLVYLFGYVLSTLVLAVLARGKNRNPWTWAFIGGLFLCPSFIALTLLPDLSPVSVTSAAPMAELNQAAQ